MTDSNIGLCGTAQQDPALRLAQVLGGAMQTPGAEKMMYETPRVALVEIEPFALMAYTGTDVGSKGTIKGNTNDEGVIDLGGGDTDDDKKEFDWG